MIRAFVVATCAALIASSPHASAQDWPSKPIRLIVPFSTGGTTDIIARLYAQRLSEALGTQFVVENRTGAGGTIGTEAGARSAPDGYTFVFGSTSSTAVSPGLYPNLSFNIVRDFAPVAQVASASIVLAAHPSLPARNVKELVALARARPGEIVYASSGNGSSLHLCAEYLKYLAKIDMLHVPYKGVGPALPDLLAGQVQLLFSDMPPFAPYIKSGKLRALGVTTAKRSPLLPDIPAIAETVPGYELAGWYGVLAPAGTPRAIVQRLHAEIQKIMRSPQMKERYVALAIEPVERTPEQFGEYVKSELAKWGKTIQVSGARIQ
ncbi:MAG: tripartite tricarboxylate transporter substrate binding protein [Betaproteobacteria bacterium]|nr:tripartite tricarboxylate transporter substrate binding protein [Betaproteobacteria bacterium]